jgi:riboflavin synthase
MFTGIIKEIGKVNKIKDSGENREMEISSTNLIKTMNVGDSIAVNGCCLTVKKLNKNSFLADISYNTLNSTTLKFTKTGEYVNLEDSLSPNSKISGHFVAGHIDCTAKILKITRIGNSYKLDIQTPEQILPYTAPKGSIALDGISLTIAESAKNSFSAAIIPYTFSNTNLKFKKAGDFVNVEVDLMSRYIEQILKFKTGSQATNNTQELNISAQASGESTINVTRSDFHYNKTNKANKINETSEINKIKEKDDSLKEKLKKHGFLE